jgi:hypothetical protein
MGTTASSEPLAVASVAARTDVEDFIAALMDLSCFPPRTPEISAQSRAAGWYDRMQTQYGLARTRST